MRDGENHDYELTEKLKKRLKRQRAAKVRSVVADANLTPTGAEQYDVPAGCNRFRVVQMGTIEKVRVEFLPSPDSVSQGQATDADAPA